MVVSKVLLQAHSSKHIRTSYKTTLIFCIAGKPVWPAHISRGLRGDCIAKRNGVYGVTYTGILICLVAGAGFHLDRLASVEGSEALSS